MAHPYDTDLRDQAIELPYRQLLVTLHYAFPTVVFTYYAICRGIAVCTLQTKSAACDHPRRRVILWLLMLSIITYFAQLINLVVNAVILNRFPPADQDTIIGLLSNALVFGVVFVGLSDTEKPVWYPFTGSIWLALGFEPIIEFLSLKLRPAGPLACSDIFNILAVGVRYLFLLFALVLYYQEVWSFRKEEGTDSERQSLLNADGNGNDHASHDSDPEAQSEGNQQNGYGGTAASSDSDSSTDASQSPTTDSVESPWERRQREANEAMEKRLKENGNWVTYAKSFLIFFPYVWPVNHRSLQTRVVLVGICLLAMNAINVLVPRQLGIIIDSLNGTNARNPWTEVLIFAGLKLVASEAGLSLLRQWLWIPVEFYSFDAMSTAAYSHVLNLSSDFHDTKSSSDIMMAIQSGQSISNMLESICFRAFPMLIDMTVAFIYLSVTFGPYEGFITIATAAVYLYIATHMIARLKKARRGEVSAWFKEHYVRQAGIQGWSTVTCFNQVRHEEARYSEAVKDRVTKSQAVYFGYVVAYAFQFLVLLSGLLAGAFLAVYQVTHGQATAGQFIMLLTYWAQLVAPLTFFAGLGKSISRDLIHAEQLLEIMQTKPTITNKEGAGPLQFEAGHVRFDQVSFSYDKQKEILKDIDFEATPGMTVAFVGATGAGKSTILKLLDRFYDVTEGSIQIDGQDIRDVDLYSLRAQIGIVPQSPILFDDTIMNNVRYARLTATDDEVYEACQAASIHEQIMGFTDGYQTRVGERGVKLSGGELQRVAIARAILKRPAIVLLDEATSAVDTETEHKIQEALRVLCKDRTTFIVAHRLSTIMNADRIIVVGGGKIVEQGSHEELISRKNGKYAELWSKQIFVKPKDKEATAVDDKPAGKGRKAPNIVNDLTPEATNSELAKVKSKPVLNTQPNDQHSDSCAGSSNESPVADENSITSGHKKEGSRLNPDAPTFTPRFDTATSSPVRQVLDISTDGSGFFDNGATATSSNSPVRSVTVMKTAPAAPPTPSINPQHVQFYAAPVVMMSAPYQFYPPRQTPMPPSPIKKPALKTTFEPPATPKSREEAKRAYFGDTILKKENVGMMKQNNTRKTGWEGPKYPYYSRRVQSKSEPSASGPGSCCHTPEESVEDSSVE